jgi:hypothetical protein
MRTALLALLLAMTSAAAAATAPCSDPRWNMRANDPSYADAMELARYLAAQRLPVRCITGTTIGSQLLGHHSAGLHTDHGSISAVFFPDPKGAEGVTTELSVKGDHYRYRFISHEGWLPRHDTIDIDGPLTFLIHGKWLIFVWDTETERVVNAALKGMYCPQTATVPSAARTNPTAAPASRAPRSR